MQIKGMHSKMNANGERKVAHSRFYYRVRTTYKTTTKENKLI